MLKNSAMGHRDNPKGSFFKSIVIEISESKKDEYNIKR